MKKGVLMAKSNLDEEQLKKEIKAFTSRKDNVVRSREFTQFKKEILPFHFTLYEKACKVCANIIQIKTDKKNQEKLEKALESCHLNTTPGGVTSFAILFPLAVMFLGMIFSFLFTTFVLGEGTFFFIIVFVIISIIMMLPLSNLPIMLANNWRIRASNQMVLSVFYIVSYMRHTSNLELAIKFTSDHLAPPLSLDLKKIIWNVETGKFDSMKDSLDNYLDDWKEYNMEFVESMHLIESSLYETSEKRRIETLEKSLSVILESTYEKMLHYAQELKSPVTMLYMIGIILPILGLVILPLFVSFMGGAAWYHIAVFYNVLLPLGVWYLSKSILSTRPTGYGHADITQVNPELKKHGRVNINLGKKRKSMNPKVISITVVVLFVFIGFFPLFLHQFSEDNYDIVYSEDYGLVSTTDEEILKSPGVLVRFLEYNVIEGELRGPFGLGATLLSITIPIGLAFGIGFYYKAKTEKLMKIREKTKQLENEFASSIFQLGNRIGDGIPAELAFEKVAVLMRNSVSGDFFELVSSNISNLGMGVEQAIFDDKYGAINKFPSALIESSMKVFVESVKKGSEVASKSLINISTYIKEMHRVDERLRDLMAEITSGMESQINYLAPLIAGIVIGLSSMIATILNQLRRQFSLFQGDIGVTDVQGAGLLDMFKNSIPTYYLQIIVGLYIIQITFLLTQILNTIKNGYDPLSEKALLGKHIWKSGLMYSFVAFLVTLLFNIIAITVIGNIDIVGGF